MALIAEYLPMPESPDNFVTQNRAGIVRLSHETIQRNPDALLLMFARLVVGHANANLMTDTVELWCFSPDFPPVAHGVIIPSYDALFAEDGEGRIVLSGFMPNG